MPARNLDFLIIGTGFGGSVCAMRLAQKGYTVTMLEEGKRWGAKDFPKSNWNLRRYLWAPPLRCFGIQAITWMRGLMVLHGKGVGGGSLVYANVLMQPRASVFRNPGWPKGIADWAEELAPYYTMARKMLGVVTTPLEESAEHALRTAAQNMGVEDTYHPVEVGVFFGAAGKSASDPYFGGQGPSRSGCIGCGGCMVGCRHGAKNSLDQNYLWFAEKSGAKILSGTRAVRIRPKTDGTYEIETENALAWKKSRGPTLQAKRVIVAAGVLGTLKLLFQNRDIDQTLPEISSTLGHHVLTNGESLLAATSFDKKRNYSRGVTIGAAIYPNEETAIQAVKYPSGSNSLRLLAIPLGGSAGILSRAFYTLRTSLRLALVGDWAKNTVILLVMKSSKQKFRLFLRRGVFGNKLSSQSDSSAIFDPVAQEAAETLANEMGGLTQNIASEALMRTPATAHILGGCLMGSDKSEGVVDLKHQVFGYPGLYVCDGSVVPVNLGVNPSLTITAMAERFVAQF